MRSFGLGFVVVECRDYSGDYLRVKPGLVKKERAMEWLDELRRAGYWIKQYGGVVKAVRGPREFLFVFEEAHI